MCRRHCWLVCNGGDCICMGMGCRIKIENLSFETIYLYLLTAPDAVVIE